MCNPVCTLTYFQNICTIFTQYLQNICTIFLQYFNKFLLNIYTLYVQYLEKKLHKICTILTQFLYKFSLYCKIFLQYTPNITDFLNGSSLLRPPNNIFTLFTKYFGNICTSFMQYFKSISYLI